MKHSAGISKQCMHARAALRKGDRKVDRKLRRCELAVRWRHLRFGWGSLSWEAYYNAACFYALLHERREWLASRSAQAEAEQAAPAGAAEAP
jgi:hypothetical protein